MQGWRRLLLPGLSQGEIALDLETSVEFEGEEPQI